MKPEETHAVHKELQRELHIANSDLNFLKKFPSNFIKTSKYNGLNFLPVSLLLQFKRYANIYFLIIAILQSISAISPLNPFSAIAPLVFVLALSMIREGIEDLARHRSDKEANSSPCLIYQGGRFVPSTWKSIQVGDILMVKQEEFLPADIVAIASSNEGGACFIETSSLDGEKNLKPKGAPRETLHLYDHEKGVVRIEGQITCMPPNAQLYAFDGTLVMFQDQRVILGPKQLLLRGSKLKNTEYVVGIAVYTGTDTKTMKNSEPSRPKQSHIEATVNKLILGILIFQSALSLGAALGNLHFSALIIDDRWYLYREYGIGLEFIIAFFSYFLLLNTMIPISLIVTLELVKLVQAFFIDKDEDLYNHKKKRSATVYTSSINEELGQVEYVFSDKTGTLTCNEMEFKIAVIGNEMYGEQGNKQPDPNNPEAHLFNDPRLNALLASKQGDSSFNFNLKNPERTKATFNIKSQYELAREYLTCLSTCHECIIEMQDGKPQFQGPSPDEITLVDAAARSGYRYIGGTEFNKKVDILGNVTDFQILHSFEFNSDRKRMSVILKDPTGVIKMYVKGADSIVKARLEPNEVQPFLEYNQEALHNFARKGLRTLLVAMRIIEPSEYEVIKQKFEVISHSGDKEAAIMKLAEDIEKNLYLLGATAVEDRLQDEVPETIRDLINANIKVWMLTGDKLETAENIAKSCNLIQPGFQVLTCSDRTKQTVQETLLHHRKAYDYFTRQKIKKALIIEGESLAIILGEPILKTLFLSISKGCEAVVCCRVTPKQKAEVVRLIKNAMNKITLAIGDGANDVNMIQEAHIGVGIYGNEGMRAVQASDFAIPEFKCLWKLLFLHGHWNYIRVSEMILYFFYKNMVFTIPQFYFAFQNGFSGRAVYDDFYITLYNLLFTAFPLAAKAVTEQDANYKYRTTENGEVVIKERPLIKKYFPKLYYVGQQNRIFTIPHFFRAISQGMIHGVIIFLVCYFALSNNILGKDGKNSDFWYWSITFYTSVVMVVDFKLAVYSKYWTSLLFFAFGVLSFIVYIAYIWVSDNFTSFLIYKTASELFSTSYFYLIVIFNAGLVLIVDFAIMYYRTAYFTSMGNYFQILIKLGKENDKDSFEYFENQPQELDDDIDYKQPKTPMLVRPVEHKVVDIDQ